MQEQNLISNLLEKSWLKSVEFDFSYKAKDVSVPV